MSAPSLRAQVADLCGDDVLAPERPSGAAPKRLPIAQAVAQCPAHRVLPALEGKEEVVVCLLEDGTRVVVPDRCPHDGGLLSDGFMDGDTLVCSRHGWEFDARTGQCQHVSRLCIPSARLAEGSGPVDS